MNFKKYVVGNEYVDRRDKADPEDQFLRWFNEPLNTGLWVSFGISGLSYTKNMDLKKLGRSVIVLVASDHENSYHDIINTGTGGIQYWGDNRDSGVAASSKRGNKIILDAYNTINTQPKELHPVILFFDKRGLKGKIKFLGVCKMVKVETLEYNYEGETVENLLISLQLIEEQKQIFVEDLHERCESELDDLVEYSPSIAEVEGLNESVKPSTVSPPNSNDGWSAERYVAKHFEDFNWNVSMVGHLKLGFDIKVSKGTKEYFVEVKSSVANSHPVFTENEVSFWNDYKENYLLAIIENFDPDKENKINWVKFPKNIQPEFSTSTTTTYRLSRKNWKLNSVNL
jgi:hypothetical protein